MSVDILNAKQLLKELGLGTYEASSYLTLLSYSSPTAAEIAKLSKVPRQKIYESMDSLNRLGLCSIKSGRVRRFEATPPEEAFNTLAERLTKETARKREKAAEMARIAESMYQNAQRDTDLLSQVEIFKSHEQVRRFYFKLLNLAKREILAFNKPPYVAHPQDLSQKKEVLKRGVDMKVIYEALGDVNRQKRLEKEIEARRAAGEKSKIAPALPMKLLIADDSYVLMALEYAETGTPSFTSLAIRHQGLAKMMKMSFERFWKS